MVLFSHVVRVEERPTNYKMDFTASLLFCSAFDSINNHEYLLWVLCILCLHKILPWLTNLRFILANYCVVCSLEGQIIIEIFLNSTLLVICKIKVCILFNLKMNI